MRRLLNYYRRKRHLANSDVSHFLELNRLFWKKMGAHNPEAKNYILVEGVAGNNYWAMMVSISAAILAIAYKSKIIFIVNKHNPDNYLGRVFQESFFPCEYVSIEELTENHKKTIEQDAYLIFNSLKKPEDVLEVSYKGLAFGEQLYDAIIKYKNASLWKVDEKVQVEIVRSLTSIVATQTLLATKNIVAGYFSHSTGTLMGLVGKVLVKNNISFYLFNGGLGAFRKYVAFENDRDYFSHYLYISNGDLDSYMKSEPTLIEKSQDYMISRLKGDIKDWDALAAFSKTKKTHVDKQSFYKQHGLTEGNPCVFIMLHAMTDDPHVFNQTIFSDYYDWFSKTLDIALETPEVNWIFKQHPMIKYYPDDANLKGIFSFLDKPNIAYIDEDTNFSSGSIPHLADAVVTCAGTASLEFTCFGVPGIIACKNHYADKGVCLEPNTFDEYENTLKSISSLPKPSNEQVQKATVLFYLMYEVIRKGIIDGILPYLTFDEMKSISPQETGKLIEKAISPDDTILSTKIQKMVTAIRDSENTQENRTFLIEMMK